MIRAVYRHGVFEYEWLTVECWRVPDAPIPPTTLHQPRCTGALARRKVRGLLRRCAKTTGHRLVALLALIDSYAWRCPVGALFEYAPEIDMLSARVA
jgi:hypothetical protein